MLEVRLLGQFEVMREGKRLTIPTRNAQSLFAYLILNAGKAIRREKLAGLLWPDSSEENARSNLRHELWRLRKALELGAESYFQVDDLTIAFNAQSDYSLDVQQLERSPLEGSTTDELIAVLSVYQGELLPGFYEEWALVERECLSALYEAKLGRLLELLQEEQRWPEVSEWARRWIALGGWPEPAYRALMTAYASGGELSRAVTTYEHYAQGLQKELGVIPSEQTQALYKRIKLGWKPETVAAASMQTKEGKPAPTPLPIRRRSNLPRPLTSFVGREKEIQQVEHLVSRARLVTITGSGGVGKTRLAIQVAGALAPQYRDGAWWVELAPLSAASPYRLRRFSNNQDTTISPDEEAGLPGVDLVAQAMAKALRVPETPGVPLLEGILEHLNDKQLLLVLDNCEHLIEACASLVERVIADCPEVTILATSREALGVPGEKAWYLPSLSLPVFWNTLELEDIYQSEAVSLFLERAGDVLPGYKPSEQDARTIAHICKRLDGIPLAIELAAARINLLSPQEIANRLDSRFSLLTSGRRTVLPRHQTLRAAIEWSYDLLSETEKILFRHISVFAGSFTLEAAEIICADEMVHSDEVLTLIGRLMDKSLLTVEPPSPDSDQATRYRLLDTIQSFSRLKLEETGETRQVRDRYSSYYMRLVETAEPELLLENQDHWYGLLQAEHDNIRAVIEWNAESDQAENALRIVGALLWFWLWFGSSREGRDLAQQILALPAATHLKENRARALNTAGCLNWMLGDLAAARLSIEEALSILKQSNDAATLALSMQFLGLILTSEGEYDLAEQAMNEGLAILRKLGDLNKSCLSLIFQGDIALIRGDQNKARSVYEENTILLQEIGNIFFSAYPIRRLGYLALERNDTLQAWDYFRESMALNQVVGDERSVCACLVSLASLALKLDKPVMAARLLGVAEHQMDSLFLNLLFLDQAELDRVRGRLQDSLEEATFTTAIEEGWKLSVKQAIEMVEKIFRVDDKN